MGKFQSNDLSRDDSVGYPVRVIQPVLIFLRLFIIINDSLSMNFFDTAIAFVKLEFY